MESDAAGSPVVDSVDRALVEGNDALDVGVAKDAVCEAEKREEDVAAADDVAYETVLIALVRALSDAIDGVAVFVAALKVGEDDGHAEADAGAEAVGTAVRVALLKRTLLKPLALALRLAANEIVVAADAELLCDIIAESVITCDGEALGDIDEDRDEPGDEDTEEEGVPLVDGARVRLPSGVPVSERAPVCVAVVEGVTLAASVTVRVEPGVVDRVPEVAGLRDTEMLPVDEPLVEMVEDGGALVETPPLTVDETVGDGCARVGVATTDPVSESERDALPAAAKVEAILALPEALDVRTRDPVASELADEFAELDADVLSRPLSDSNEVSVVDAETDAETRLLPV